MKEVITTDQAPKATGILSQGIISNGCIYTSGQVHLTPDGVLLDGSTQEMTKQIMNNLGAILKAAGADFDDLVKATIYVMDMSFGPDINEVYTTYFTEPLLAREMIGVKELPLGASIEISLIAAQT